MADNQVQDTLRALGDMVKGKNQAAKFFTQFKS